MLGIVFSVDTFSYIQNGIICSVLLFLLKIASYSVVV